LFDKQRFIKSIYNLKDLPKDKLPEIILCGRSNVGKSSFINSLFQKKDLAKISSTTGKTRSINYYLIDDKFYLVDLPGYGYAKTSKKEREFWGKLLNEYISLSPNIQLAFHIVDSRHDPSELDIRLNEMLKEINIPYVLVLNKVDKLKQSELASAKKRIKEFFPELSFQDNLFVYSSVKGTGRKEVLQRLSKLLYNS